MLKSLFSKLFGKKEEVTPPLNPSPLIVDILTWIRSLETCKDAVKKCNFKTNKGCQSEDTTSYQISDDTRVIHIQKCVYGNKYDMYRDIFGYHCDLISEGYELYTLSNVKKKEQMEKAVKVFHACVIANRIKKFMEYDFMADNPTIN